MQLFHIHKVLAPTDFSDHSFYALGYARTFADKWNAELHLLNVLEPAVFPTEAGLTPMGVMNLDSELASASESNMEELTKREELQGIQVVKAIAHGRASTAIADYAREHDIDLVILSTHGRTGLEHLIFGSTTERVVRECPCPVLTVRTPPKNED